MKYPILAMGAAALLIASAPAMAQVAGTAASPATSALGAPGADAPAHGTLDTHAVARDNRAANDDARAAARARADADADADLRVSADDSSALDTDVDTQAGTSTETSIGADPEHR